MYLEIAMCDCDGIFSSLQNSTRGDDQQGFNEFCRRGGDSVQHKGHDSQLCKQWGTWKPCGIGTFGAPAASSMQLPLGLDLSAPGFGCGLVGHIRAAPWGRTPLRYTVLRGTPLAF